MSQPTFSFASNLVNRYVRFHKARHFSTAIAFRQPTATGIPQHQQTQQSSISYRVGRSASQNLAVYHRIKAGGTSRTTEIKKVEGDVKALSIDLQSELNLDTTVNTRTNTIVVKGFHKDRLLSWLEGKGF